MATPVRRKHHAWKQDHHVNLFLVPVITLCLLMNAAYAGSLNGAYAGTGSGSALFALCGFDSNGFPKQANLGAYETITVNTEGTWAFAPDGTGTLDVKSEVISLANTLLDSSYPEGLRFPWYGENIATAKITYELDQSTGTLDINGVTTTTRPTALFPPHVAYNYHPTPDNTYNGGKIIALLGKI